jgi:hypothetical protein
MAVPGPNRPIRVAVIARTCQHSRDHRFKGDGCVDIPFGVKWWIRLNRPKDLDHYEDDYSCESQAF